MGIKAKEKPVTMAFAGFKIHCYRSAIKAIKKPLCRGLCAVSVLFIIINVV